jgi:protein-arginine kinase activator protein McsA
MVRNFLFKECLTCNTKYSSRCETSKFCSKSCYQKYWIKNIKDKAIKNQKHKHIPWNKGKSVQTNTGRTHFNFRLRSLLPLGGR